MKRFLLIVLSCLSLSAYAGATKGKAPLLITVQGVLVSYDAKFASIRTAPDTVVKVPLKSLKVPPTGMVAGKATVQAQLTVDEMTSLNKIHGTEKR